mmetsp:Transcript_22042/g.70365  ORF Transcript_22042/g.70365 Transcript_22042/m.70365 type:complete len:377 (+) Transcript_22042:327-1457(+)
MVRRVSRARGRGRPSLRSRTVVTSCLSSARQRSGGCERREPSEGALPSRPRGDRGHRHRARRRRPPRRRPRRRQPREERCLWLCCRGPARHRRRDLGGRRRPSRRQLDPRGHRRAAAAPPFDRQEGARPTRPCRTAGQPVLASRRAGRVPRDGCAERGAGPAHGLAAGDRHQRAERDRQADPGHARRAREAVARGRRRRRRRRRGSRRALAGAGAGSARRGVPPDRRVGELAGWDDARARGGRVGGEVRRACLDPVRHPLAQGVAAARHAFGRVGRIATRLALGRRLADARLERGGQRGGRHTAAGQRRHAAACGALSSRAALDPQHGGVAARGDGGGGGRPEQGARLHGDAHALPAAPLHREAGARGVRVGACAP